MSMPGIATEALATAPTAERHQQRLTVVPEIAAVAVAAEYMPDYFNDLAGDEQIAFGD